MVNTILTKSVNIFYMDTDNDLVKAIAGEMERRNMGVREAARVIGVSHPTLMKALAGDKITFEFAESLSKFLRLSTENVLRLAGLLPRLAPGSEYYEKLIHKINSMSEEDKEHLMNYIDFLLSKQG